MIALTLATATSADGQLHRNVTPHSDLRHGQTVRVPRMRAETVALPVGSFSVLGKGCLLTSSLKVAWS